MSTESAPNRDAVINSIVLVFSNSKLKDVAGTDALRSVLGGNYRDIVRGTSISLQPVWDLLVSQPGFSKDDALPPFCVLKNWESDLGGVVTLPVELGQLSATEIMAYASHCPIPKGQRQKVTDPGAARERARALAKKSEEYIAQKSEPSAPTRKPAIEAVLAGVAVLGLAIGGYTLWGFVGGPKIKSFSVSDIEGDLPIESGKRLGREVDVILSDESWLQTDASAREAALTTALKSLESSDIDILVVHDKSGKIRASAQWFGTPRSPRVILR